MRKILLLAALVAVGALAGCTSHHSPQASQESQINRAAGDRVAYVPHHNVEFNNYNESQKLYDDPATIIWCTTTWGNPSAPMVSIPIAGKLTSSSTTFFNPSHIVYSGDTGLTAIGSRSVDGMYHPNPPQYRFGFTPGGQYVDFFNMPTLCTTALTKFQRQQTKVSLTVDPTAEHATKQAEAVLKAGTLQDGTIKPQAQAQAQKILEGAGLG